MDQELQPSQIRDWLTRLEGPNRDDRVISKMRSVGVDRIFPYLREFLNDADPEFRCLVSLAIFHIDPRAGFDLILPLLDDPEIVVRWNACGLLHDIGDPRAVQQLIHIMQTDPEPGVRNTAAYALGGIGDPRAIPALIKTLDDDHELDELGYSASSCAATALDDIMKTNHTRIKVSDDLCTMSPTQTDLVLLKAQAMEFYLKQQPDEEP